MKQRRVRDLMQSNVTVVSPETSLLDVHRLFVEEEINGAPVVDENTGKVLGIITTFDLVRAVRDEFDTTERMGELTVADAMSRERIAVPPSMPVAEAADLMREQHVHRVLVIDNHELVGILTTFDLLSALAPERALHRRRRAAAGRAAGDPQC